MKFKALSKHIVNGSTLVAFGLTVLSFSYLLFDKGYFILSGIIALCSMWFGFWGFYEFVFVGFISKKQFFEDDNKYSNKDNNNAKQKKKSKRKQ